MRSSILLRSCFVLSSCIAAACGGSSASVDDPLGPQGPPSGAAGEPSTGDPGRPGDPSASETPGVPGSGSPAGAEVTITMRGSTAPFAHADGFSGRTPRKQIVAIRSLWLLRSPTDPRPVRVFDHGARPVEADLVSGRTTELARVSARSLPAGVYTLAKAGAAYVKYAVDARMHTPAPFDGYYDNEQVLSDGAVMHGKPQKRGHFRYSFVSGGATLGTLEGEDAPTPAATTGGGITMDTSGPETFYVFPVEVTVDPNVARDQVVDFEVNVDASFRWREQSRPGYSTGVFDTTPSTFEPVMAFGANAFRLTIAPK